MKMSKKTDWRKSQQAEIKFWKKGPKVYNHFSTIYWKKEFSEFGRSFDIFESKKIIEIGCGPKGMIHYIPGNEKIGLDPLIEEYEDLGILEDGNVKHIKGSAERINFSNNYFDIAICFNVLDHTENPKEVLREIKRVLKFGGILILHTHFVIYWFKKLFIFLIKKLDKPHLHHFNYEEINKMINDANGYEAIFKKNTIFHWKSKNIIKHIIAKVIVRNYYVILKKAF